jgi:hypothetical protein
MSNRGVTACHWAVMYLNIAGRVRRRPCLSRDRPAAGWKARRGGCCCPFYVLLHLLLDSLSLSLHQAVSSDAGGTRPISRDLPITTKRPASTQTPGVADWAVENGKKTGKKPRQEKSALFDRIPEGQPMACFISIFQLVTHGASRYPLSWPRHDRAVDGPRRRIIYLPPPFERARGGAAHSGSAGSGACGAPATRPSKQVEN